MINKDFLFYKKFKYSRLKKNNNVITTVMLIFIILLLLIFCSNSLFGTDIFNNHLHNLKSKNVKNKVHEVLKIPQEKWKYIYELKNEK
ncbi:hypothetical protein XW81_02680 [Buchnera aphidicola (Schlechtendalia chinensis)]|uniref:Uncharacterized protein n=1 Tax=Buchnera aphidicola subsp. Schlechtendalia chinensis TaxID=118110 RepID=A0A172WE67_BUCSC|nr:hypothetical protein [Buchnera aphidicola]ANF17269.1 hypothetical protein XW81_02680 [Buchnera aphidicola (Schlechtendalia chinensis)]